MTHLNCYYFQCCVVLGVFFVSSIQGFQNLNQNLPRRSSNDAQASRRSQLKYYERKKKSVSTALSATKLADLSPTKTAAVTHESILSPWESWCVDQLKEKYEQALTIKCPFFRRRAADLLDATDMVIRFLMSRHKSLPFSPPGWRCRGDLAPKRTGISQNDLLEVIRSDWREDSHKGYYVTGRLTTAVYRDDVIFDGPDPDMPVRGLRKYLNAASQLFDQQQTVSELLSLDVIDGVIVARWRMKGVLRLPWRPAVPEWSGTTSYYTDEHGLIYRHEETWDKSVIQAFLQTLCPQVADQIWCQT